MMPLYIYVAACSLAMAIPLVLWSLGGLRAGRAVPAVRFESRDTDLRKVVLAQSSSERLVEPTMEALANQARRVTPKGIRDTLERRISHAGFAGRLTLDGLLVIKMALAGIVAGFGGLIWLLSPSVAGFVVTAVLSVALWFLPDLLLSGRASERQQRIGEELPELLDQMTVSVEAGLGFEAALARVVEEGGSAASEEFGWAHQDIRLGVSRENALMRVVDRSTSADLKHFVLALSQAERLGVPLASVLRVLADEMRERRRVLAQERAMKVPAKLVFPLVLCIMPALFVAILGPSLVSLFDKGFL